MTVDVPRHIFLDSNDPHREVALVQIVTFIPLQLESHQILFVFFKHLFASVYAAILQISKSHITFSRHFGFFKLPVTFVLLEKQE